MSRLTEKKNNKYVYDDIYCGKHIDKLGQLEDIEEELGIDLITLFKALKQEVIYIKFDNKPHHFMIEQRFGKYLIYDKEWLIELKDYGKTWALTKEELL